MIMKNYSFVVTVVMVLLNASCMNCVNDGVERFNKHLEKETKTFDLGENIEAASSYADEDIADLLELFQKIKPENDCTADNIDNIWQFSNNLEKVVPKFFEEETHLGQVMLKCYEDARDKCFKEFEDEWIKRGQQIMVDIKCIGFAEFDKTNNGEFGAPEPLAEEGDIRRLQVAVYNYFDIPQSSVVERPTDEELRSVGGTWERDYKSLFRMGSKRSKPVKYSLDDVKQMYETFYREPCDNLVKRQESESILKPVGQLADLIKMDELKMDKLNMKPNTDEKILSFLWASRYYSCKVMLSKDGDQMIKAIKKAINAL